MNNRMSLSDALARVVMGILSERRLDRLEFAESLPYSKSTVYRQLNNETAITTDHLDYIAEVLDVPLEELVSRANTLRDQQGLRSKLSKAEQKDLDDTMSRHGHGSQVEQAGEQERPKRRRRGA